MGSWLQVEPDDEDAVAAVVDRLQGELAEWAAGRGRAVDAELVAHLLQMRARYGGDGELDVWDEDTFEALLLHIASAKTVFDDAERDDAVAGLGVLVDFLADRGLLAADSDPPARLHATLQQLARPFAEAVADPSRRSPATALAYAMRDDGVDLTDEQAVGEWLTAFNAGSQQQRDAVLNPPAPADAGTAAAGGPWSELPTVLAGVEVDEGTLAERAAATPMVRALRGLVDYLGQHGRELSEDSGLADADAQAVAELLGGEDAGVGPDDADAAFWVALDAGFVRRRSGRAMAVKARRPTLADRPLEAWQAAAATLLEQGVLSAAAPEEPFADWFDEAAPELLLGLWAAGRPLEPAALAEASVDDVRRSYGLDGAPSQPCPADLEDEAARHVALLARQFAFAGLVELEIAGLAAQPQRITVEDLPHATAAITPLAKRLLEPLAEGCGFTVAPVGELVDLDVETLLAELQDWAVETAEAEVRAWIAARGDAAAAAELAAVLPTAEVLTRQLGLAALGQLGAAAEPTVRTLAEDADLRPYAIAWLVHRGLASPEELSSDDAAAGTVDVVAALLVGGASPDDAAEVLLAGLADRDHALAHIGELWRVNNPHTPTVLEALGDAGDAQLAKAARKALFKYRSQG